jgi:hypothetical protein
VAEVGKVVVSVVGHRVKGAEAEAWAVEMVAGAAVAAAAVEALMVEEGWAAAEGRVENGTASGSRVVERPAAEWAAPMAGTIAEGPTWLWQLMHQYDAPAIARAMQQVQASRPRRMIGHIESNASSQYS